jgi:glycosyltransferase involved in cell wall biosynthesis
MSTHPVAYGHELSKLLSMRGHKTASFAASPLHVTGGQPYSVFRRNFEGVDIYGVANRDRDAGFDPLADISNSECERAFCHVTEHFAPDVVHFQSLKGLSSSLIPLAQSMGMTCIISMHDYQHICPKRHLLDRNNEVCSGPEDGRKCAACIEGQQADACLEAAYAERRRLVLHWVNGADRLIAPSAIAREAFAEQGIDSERMVVVTPSSLVAERLWESHSENVSEDRMITFAFLGSVARRNAPHLLVDAVKLLRDLSDKCRVLIHGQIEDEEYRREIEAAIRNLGDHAPDVEFAGQYRPDRLGEMFAKVDVFVAPQIWSNPLSRSTMEALGAGAPVIASMMGSVAEFIGHGYNGLVFEPGNYIDLAAQMRQLIENPVMVASMRANINAPRPMSWHADKMIELYESAIGTTRTEELVPAQRKAA